ncbi:MAG: mobile mystery protein B [Candidatus Aminicenantes bacterium]|nr:mobile mystery protein B [Candidatus Aminicenantes bacterium]
MRNFNQDLPPGATPMTAEEFEGLLPSFITTRKDLNDAESKNNSEALKKYFLFKRKKSFRFELIDLFLIHKEMFGHVWLWAGKKRKTNKNIGVDKAQIDIEVKKLTDDLDYWLVLKMDTIEISARLHHRLVYIHPFNNGNGRWARFVVNLFLKEHMNSFIRFPEDELLLTTEIRNRFIRALQAADKSDYGPLIEFHREFIAPA